MLHTFFIGLSFIVHSALGSAPTVGPSQATGRLPALGWISYFIRFWIMYSRCYLFSDGILGTRINAVCWPSHFCLTIPLIFSCKGISESVVLAAANQFVSLGLKDAGYQYINIDVCRLLLWRGLVDFNLVRIAGRWKIEIHPLTKLCRTHRSFLMALVESPTKFTRWASRLEFIGTAFSRLS